jgi:PAS domain S-box-containing protein
LAAVGSLLLYRRSRQLVQRLTQAHSRLNAILRNVPAGVITLGLDGSIHSANRMVGELFGYEPDEVIGMHWDRLLGNDGESGSPLLMGTQTCVVRRKCGDAFHIEIVASEFHQGRRIKRIAIVRDITVAKEAEQALRQSETSLTSAQRIARIGSWELDIATGARYWSDETYRIFNKEPGGAVLLYRELLQHVHTDDRARVAHVVESAVKRLNPYDVSYRVVFPDGQEKILNSLGRVEYDADGRPVRFLGTVQDITEKQQVEALLRRREAEFRALVENSPDMIARFDGDLRLVYVNPVIEAVTGMPPHKIIGKTFGETHIASNIADLWTRAIRKVIETRAADTFEFSFNMPFGERHYQVLLVPESQLDGAHVTVLAMARDISMIKHGESLLRELTAHQEAVREEERKKVAREVHDELGQALTALRMDVSMLRISFGGHNPEFTQRIQNMKDAVDRTIQIVRNVTTALRPAALDLGLVAALEWLVEDVNRRSRVTAVLRTKEPDMALHDSSATALFRVVQESLTNVLKHAEATRVEVTLQVEDDVVLLEVSDNGAGFDADHPAAATAFGIMGMRERALILGGKAEIRSTIGVGTRVMVWLPFHPAAQTPEKEPLL